MPAWWVIHFARSLKHPTKSSPRKPPRNLALVIRGRIRSVLKKSDMHSGWPNAALNTDKNSRTNPHAASASDYANTHHRSITHRHRSAHKAWRTSQHPRGTFRDATVGIATWRSLRRAHRSGGD